LDPDRYDVIPIGISKSGEWIAGDQALEMLKSGTGTPTRVFLPLDPSLQHLIPLERQNGSGLPESLSHQLDVVFPVIHGPFGEDGTLQGALELSGIPYVGGSVLGSALAMDKILQKQVSLQTGLPVVDFLWIRKHDWVLNRDEEATPILTNQLANMDQRHMILMVEDRLGFPVFVKPANLGSSVGISKAHSVEELKQAIDLAFEFDRKVLIERAVIHPREFEVSILGNDDPRASVVGEVVASNEFYDYNAKYVDNKSQLYIPADIDDELQNTLQLAAIKAFVAVDCRGLARVDFLYDTESHRYFLSEVNTIPGFTTISMYPKLWEASGLAFSALLDELIDLALEFDQIRTSGAFSPGRRWFS
jgi:D-alanine-D-alanine ligase